MAQVVYSDFPLWWRKSSAVILALFWLAGLLLGVILFSFADDSVVSLMHNTPDGIVSIVGQLSVTVLPFLFSAFAVYVLKPGLLLPVSFLKAFSFSFVSMGILVSYGSSGWLLRWFLMFSDILSLPVLYSYWQRHISGEVGFSVPRALLALSLLILIGSFNFRYISPLLADLLL